MGLLSNIDPHIQRLSAYATVATLMIGGYTWLASNLSWFAAMGFAEKVALAIPAALVTLLVVTASLAMYRYFRPLSSNAKDTGDKDGSLRTAVERPELPLASDGRTLTERLNKIETTYRAVQEAWDKGPLEISKEILPRIEHLTNRVDKLDKELEALEPTLRRLTRLADLKDAQERFAFLDTKLRDMRAHVLRPPTGISFAAGNSGKAAWMNFQNKIFTSEQRFMQHRMTLDQLGFTRNGRDEAIKAAVEEIKGDAIHVVLQDDEKENPWANGGQKRHWLCADAAMQAQISFYAKELETLRREADWVSSNVGA